MAAIEVLLSDDEIGTTPVRFGAVAAKSGPISTTSEIYSKTGAAQPALESLRASLESSPP